MQDISDEERVNLGSRAAELLSNQTFLRALQDIEEFCVKAFLTSRYDDEKTRQAAYYQASSIQQVKDLLTSWVSVRDQIISSNDESVED